MAGPDSIRGFNFQHARAVHAALDLLESPHLQILEVEGDDDIIDFQLIDAVGKRRVVAQVKSRNAPPWWTPAELLTVISRWEKLPQANDAVFQFLSDGAPGEEVARALLPALGRLKEGITQHRDDEYLKNRGLSDSLSLLSRVQISLQEPPVGAQLDQAELRVLRLLQGRRHATPKDAAAVVDRLFRVISVMGGEGKIVSRRVTREEIAELVGIALNDLDNRGAWTEEVADKLRAAYTRPQDDALVDLGLDPVTLTIGALWLVDPAERSSLGRTIASLADLLDEQAGACLVGPSGRGKSTALQQLAAIAAKRGQVPVVAPVREYRAGSLLRLLRQELERIAQTALTFSAVETWLMSGAAVIVVDDVSERPAPESRVLLEDVRTLRRDWPVARVFLAAREVRVVRRSDFPTYALADLDRQQQEAVATELLGDNGRILVQRLDRTLGDATRNPLLLRMALSLVAAGVEPDSTYAIFDGFLEGIRARGNVDLSDRVLAGLEGCAQDLVADERFSADSHWWRAALRGHIDRLFNLGVFEREGFTAEGALAEILASGLLRADPATREVFFLHDSFRDFFAARGFATQPVELPRPLDERYEATADHLAEAAEPSVVLLRALCDNPIAAARAAAKHDPCPDGDTMQLAGELLRQLLCTHQLPGLPEADKACMLGYRGTSHLYIAISSDGMRDGEMTQERFGATVRAAVLTLSFARDSGPLRLAIICWQELLRMGFDALSRRVRPESIPRGAQELAVAVEMHFRQTSDALEELATATCASLSGRLVEEVAWPGLDAVVSPHGVADHFSGEVLQPMSWTHDTDIVRAVVAEPPEHDDGWSSGGFAEYYLRDPPREVAITQLSKALGRLLDTWGPG